MFESRIARLIPALTSASLLIFSGWHDTRSAEPVAGGSQRRVAWSTSRITGSPEPPLPYVTENAFPLLKFDRCLDITNAPGTDRLFVAEQGGKIVSFSPRSSVASADVVIDLSKAIPGAREVYAVAFHPQFETNRYCYVCYIMEPGKEDGTHIARFRVSDRDPPTIDPTSETTIITWLSGGHNGCDLAFGPDGYLYISTGDGVGPNPPDTLQTGQDVSDLLSSILRIDVDGSDSARNYRIPADNPFVELKEARGEVWAYGLRNPWRLSFDRQTGDLWVGDVGWELWEMLNCVQRGGNYGWAVMEGLQTTNPTWPRGPTPILPPTIQHPHSESSSITDGLTYYGTRLTELYGHHVYGDYDTGKIWAFRFRDGQVVDQRELADTSHRIVGFGEDHQGEMYVLDHIAGTIHRLVPNPETTQSTDFPRRLSETGLFRSVAQQIPAPGVVQYTINAQPWADHATSERFVAVPGDVSLERDGKRWKFPKESVLVKTISIEMQRGHPESRRRLETQILHLSQGQWNPYTYRWNEQGTDATLLGASGASLDLEVVDDGAPKGIRHQTWRLSSRAECQRCHNKWSGPVLGFNVEQLHTGTADLASDDDQLSHLTDIGLFAEQVPPTDRIKMADPYDPSADCNDRARAYLQVNCAHCHRQHAGGSVISIMHNDVPLGKTRMIDERPTQGTFGIPAARVIAPGDPWRSVLFYRMSKLGGGRMPHLGSSEADISGLDLMQEWIESLPEQSNTRTRDHEVAIRRRRGELADLAGLCQNQQSADQASATIDRLLSTTTGALMLQRSIDNKSLSTEMSSLVVTKAAHHREVSVRDLFEHFLPPEQRTQRLGTVIHADQILALVGDSIRGRKVFFETAGVQCKTCHRIDQHGVEVGPDLEKVGRKYGRAELLETILEPSKVIDPKYLTYVVETTEGQVFTGLMEKKDSDEVVLRQATNELIRISAKRVESATPQQRSLMPELLLRDMTAQQVADLLEYLSSLK